MRKDHCQGDQEKENASRHADDRSRYAEDVEEFVAAEGKEQ